jgi:F0F1-type ATP synthase assembly protein I
MMGDEMLMRMKRKKEKKERKKEKKKERKNEKKESKKERKNCAPITVASAVFLATGMVYIGCLLWKATPKSPFWISLVSAPASSTWNLM